MAKGRVLGTIVVALVAAAEARGQTAPPADQPAQSLPAITVTSTPSTEPYSPQLLEPSILHTPTQSTSVIGRRQLELMSPSSLTGILDQVPGVTISRSGGIGGQAFVRGLNTNDFRVPVFVNGNRFRGRNTLQFLYFPPEEIERIEVIRGPASGLFGSDALGGLINIVTKRAKPAPDHSMPLQVTGGGTALTGGTAAGTTNGQADIEGAGLGFDARVSYGVRQAGNYQTPLGAIPNSDFQAVGGAATIGYTPAPGHHITLDLRDQRVSDGTAGAPGAPYIRARGDDNRVDMASLAYSGTFNESLVRQVEASFYVNGFYTEQSNSNNSVLSRNTFTESNVIGPLVIGGRLSGEIPWTLFGGQAKTTIGTDFYNENRPGPLSWGLMTRYSPTGTIAASTLTPSTQTGPDTAQTNVGVFGLQEWLPTPQWTLSGSVRYDWINTRSALSPLPSPALLPLYAGANDVIDSAVTGSAGIAYRPIEALELYGNFATSFRAPTTFDKYTSSVTASGLQFPNPSIQPERGITFEAGYRMHLPTASLTLAAYHSQFNNFIQTVQLTAGNSQRQNVGTVTIDGAELEGRWQVVPTVTLFGTATTLLATNITTNVPVPYITPLFGNVGAQYAPPSGAFSVIGRVDWAASKTRIDPAQEFPTAGYAVANAYVELKLGELVAREMGDATLILGLENIFNTAYVRGSTVPSMTYPWSSTNPLTEPGTNFTVTLRKRF
jgi:hemoglobin/transferrin/lactoferrin receptor protein